MRPATASQGLALALAMGFATASSAAQAPLPPPGILVNQPAGDVCPAGGRNVGDTYAPTPQTPDQTRAPRLKTAAGAFKVDTLATGINRGTAMAALPDGRVLISLGRDQLRIIDKAGKLSEPLAGSPAIPEGRQAGIQDIALDRAFATNRTLYLTYNANKPGAVAPGPDMPIPNEGWLVSARLSAKGDAVENLKVLYRGSTLRRVAMLGDGTLAFATISPEDKSAQSLETGGGKVLRVRADGSVPKDNPYASRTDEARFIYSLGHRDPEGLAVDGQGRLWANEHGLRGGDELNMIRSGRNYGHPTITYGRENSGEPTNGGALAAPGLEQPVYFWTPSVAPSGMQAYSGAMFPAWKGDLFVGGLVAQSLIRLKMSNGRVVGEEFLLAERCNRIRDVRQGADGSLYVLTDGAAGQVLRLSKG